MLLGKMGKEKLNLCFLTLDTYVKKVFPISPRFYSDCFKIPITLKQQVYYRVGAFSGVTQEQFGNFQIHLVTA